MEDDWSHISVQNPFVFNIIRGISFANNFHDYAVIFYFLVYKWEGSLTNM